MAVKIRLQRGGATHSPYYRVVVTDVRSPRDGRFVEKVGRYDPKNKGVTQQLNLELERIDYWLGVGAQTSDTVRSLIKRARTGKPVSKEAPVKVEEAAPVAEEAAAPEAVAEEAAPVVEEAAPEPVAEEVAAEPVAEEVAAEPVAEEAAPEPVAEEAAAEPVAEEAATEPEAEEAAEEEPKKTAE